MVDLQDLLNEFRAELRSAGLCPDEIIPAANCTAARGGKPSQGRGYGSTLMSSHRVVAEYRTELRPPGLPAAMVANQPATAPGMGGCPPRREIELVPAHAEAAERANKMLGEAVEWRRHPTFRERCPACPGLKVDGMVGSWCRWWS